MNERRGNVFENKGQFWKTSERSGNVIESKDSYTFCVRMSLKTQYVICKSRAVFAHAAKFGSLLKDTVNLSF